MKTDLFNAREQYENFIEIENYKKAKKISPSDGVSIEFNYHAKENTDCILHLRGNTDMPKSWRTEDNYPLLYRRVSESLENDILVAHGNGENMSRNVYYKVYGDEIGNAREFDFKIEYLLEGNVEYARSVVEIFYKGDGTRTIENNDADIIKTIDFEPTDGKFKKQNIHISTANTVDFIFVRIETEKLDGKIKLKSPELLTGGINIIEPFKVEPLELKTHRWIGENFSKIEWIPFKIEINGTIIFDSVKFERIYVCPSYEFVIPDGVLVNGNNEIKISYPQKYSGQLDFILKAVKLVESKKRGIVAYNDTASKGIFPILVKALKGDSIIVKTDYTDGVTLLTDKIKADSDGLYVVKFLIKKSFSTMLTANISVGGVSENVIVDRFVEKSADVRIGSGDTIYIDMNRRDIDRFLAWYFANECGNMLVFRTSYRWSGCTSTDPEYWAYVSKLLDDMQVSYSLMVDGRELNSAKTNSEGFKGGELFEGYQSHEQDGAYLYWGSVVVRRENIFFNEVLSRRFKYQGMLPKGSIIRKGDVFYKHYDGDKPQNIEEANAQLIDNFKIMTQNSTRHTGPSIMFKYIAEAGIDWLGAELMYGPFDVVNSALRGASRAIGNPHSGAHIAVQWSTSPHDTVYRYRRYLYSLYNCYMNGIDNINTEEGFYRMESHYADFERDSAACLNHTAAEREVYEYIRSHHRRGEQAVNIGILHGKYDPINVFSRGNAYGMHGSEWKYASPEKSWDLLTKVFYKGAKLRSIYLNPCPNLPNGYFSKTPYGQVDIVPIEAGNKAFTRYKTLFMLGWNTADEQMIDELTAFVENGGTLVLSAPHLYTTVDRTHAIKHTSHILLSDNVKKLIGINDLKRDNRVSLNTARECGNRFKVASDEVLLNEIGKGKVYFVNHFKYPHEIKTLYTNIMERIANETMAVEQARGIVTPNGFVTTSVFDSEDRRVIYMLDTKWWRKNKHAEHVTAMIANIPYRLTVRRDVLNQLNIFGDIGIFTYDTTTDIISLKGDTMTLQGCGISEFAILRDGKVETIVVDFEDASSIEIKLD